MAGHDGRLYIACCQALMDRSLVIVTTSFPVVSDGSEAAGSFVYDLAEELASEIHVRVVAPGPVATIEHVSSTFEVYRFAAPSTALSSLRIWHPCDLVRIIKVLREGARAVDAATDTEFCAHILALWVLPSGYWGRRTAMKRGISYSVWALGSDIWSLGSIPIVRGYLRKVLNDSENCYSDGLLLAEQVKKISGRAVTFLPSARRLNNASRVRIDRSSPYRLIFLGRWHPNKGVDLLLSALGMLSDEAWESIHAVDIYGGGPMEPIVRRNVATLRGAGRPVNLYGYLDKTDAEKAIASADFLLIPSRIESIPVVFSDAMKLFCPVISTPVGDLPRIMQVHPVGCVAESVSPSAYSRAISLAVRADKKYSDAEMARVAALFSLSRTASILKNISGALD